LKLYFSLLSSLLLLANSLQAQNDFKPLGLRVGFDAIKLATNIIDPQRSAFELNADLSLNKYLIAADAGWAKVDGVGSNYTYLNEGNYLRVGADYNILHRNPFGNALFIGLRYGAAKFDEELIHAFQVPTYDVQRDTVSVSGVNANWMELAAGLRVRVRENLFVGYTIRYRLGANVDTQSAKLEGYEIPGYGKAESGGFAFGYSIMYRIPFFKPSPPSFDRLMDNKP
jgi:hypothetical protein